VRDNERTIRACLESIRPWVDEMIVVDTGSRDATPEIARALGARVFHFPWCDDFSAARNESLRHSRGYWIFWMDSDDTIDPVNGRKLRELADRDPPPGVMGFVMQVQCPGAGEDGEQEMTVVDHVKLFRNLPGNRFKGRIHEQIIEAIKAQGGSLAFTDIFVVHSGYDHSPEGQRSKLERDLRLLHLELGGRPEHSFTLFNLGMTYANVGRHEEAIDYLKRSIARSNPGESQLRKAYAILVSSYHHLARREAAWETCEQGLDLFPNDAELRFRKAILLHDAGRLEEAAQTYLEVLRTDEERHFQSLVPGIKGFMARQNLAAVYTDMGQPAKAEEQWRKVVEEVPGYRAGWRGLVDVLIQQGKYADGLAVAKRLEADARLRNEGVVLKSRVVEAQGDLAAARRELEQGLRHTPDDTVLLNALCRFLFERVDIAEAEGPLKQLLRGDPENAATHRSLGMVYRRTGRLAEAIEAHRQSLRLRPGCAATYLHLGHALWDNGQRKEAVAAWEKALRLDPGNGDALAALGQAKEPER
jgi:tetratricopeptide (TPR) repeat protein